MFDFQKLKVYHKSKQFYSLCFNLSKKYTLKKYEVDQLGRASFSIPLNIAEGCGKISKADRRNYFTTARASVFECIAIIEILGENYKIDPVEITEFNSLGDEISRMLYTMIKNLE
jgi:four helix bundle protein